MKKLIYTLSFVALISITAKSQTDKPASKQTSPKKEVANTDAPAQAKGENMDKPAGESKGTRMAINEKGVPASRAAKDKAAKEEKAPSPGQPAATEKK